VLIQYGEIQTPLGAMTAGVNKDSIIWLDFGCSEDGIADMKKRVGRNMEKVDFTKDDAVITWVKQLIGEYFAGRDIDIPQVIFTGTTFQNQVWQELLQIGYGEVCSYKDIAERIGNPKAVRAVGQAVNRNPISILVPCHRIIGSNGHLTGYNGGIDKKTYLLNLEQK